MKVLVPIHSAVVDALKCEKETGPGYHVVAIELKDGRQAVLRGEIHHPLAIEDGQHVSDHQDRVRKVLSHLAKRRIEIVGLMDPERYDQHAAALGFRFGSLVTQCHPEIVGIP